MKEKNSLIFTIAFVLSIFLASPFLLQETVLKGEKIEEIEEIEEDFVLAREPKKIHTSPHKKEHLNIDQQEHMNADKTTNKKPNKNTSSNSNDNSYVPPVKDDSYVINPNFVKVDDDYFKDALFIGDSRTVGIKYYGKIKKTTFFADTGMSIYNINKKKIKVSGVGTVTLKELFQKKQYEKIYIMLGINEIGYNLDNSYKKFKKEIEFIQKYEPNAIIFIQGSLHVTKEKSDKEKTFRNSRIDSYNKKLSSLADKKSIFYIDANHLFDDGKGNLKKTYTGDNVHLYAKYYPMWVDYLKDCGILKEKREL